MYFRMGNPLGLVESKVLCDFIVEINGEHIALNVFSSTIWTNMSSSLPDDEAMNNAHELLIDFFNVVGIVDQGEQNAYAHTAMRKMVEKNVFVHFDSNVELFNYIKDFKLIRTGFPLYDLELFKKTGEFRNLILIAESDVSLSKTQLKIWQKANGINTISQIYEDCFSNLSIDDFMDNLIYISDKGTVYAF